MWDRALTRGGGSDIMRPVIMISERFMMRLRIIGMVSILVLMVGCAPASAAAEIDETEAPSAIPIAATAMPSPTPDATLPAGTIDVQQIPEWGEIGTHLVMQPDRVEKNGVRFSASNLYWYSGTVYVEVCFEMPHANLRTFGRYTLDYSGGSLGDGSEY